MEPAHMTSSSFKCPPYPNNSQNLQHFIRMRCPAGFPDFFPRTSFFACLSAAPPDASAWQKVFFQKRIFLEKDFPWKCFPGKFLENFPGKCSWEFFWKKSSGTHFRISKLYVFLENMFGTLNSMFGTSVPKTKSGVTAPQVKCWRYYDRTNSYLRFSGNVY